MNIKINVVINDTHHEVILGKTDSVNKKIKNLVKELGMDFRTVKIQVSDFPVKGRHLIKYSGHTDLNAVH